MGNVLTNAKMHKGEKQREKKDASILLQFIVFFSLEDKKTIHNEFCLPPPPPPPPHAPPTPTPQKNYPHPLLLPLSLLFSPPPPHLHLPLLFLPRLLLLLPSDYMI